MRGSYIAPDGTKQRLTTESSEKLKTARTTAPLPLHYAGMGFYLLTPLLLGVIIGVFLKRYYDGNDYVILVSIAIGLLGTFYQLFKTLKEHATPYKHKT